jgi:CRISPR/Cas system-associated exonuclease Cas4 (RecB family)
LRGYDKDTWLSSSSFAVNVSTITSHLFCPRCSYKAYKNKKFTKNLSTVQGSLLHFAVEQILGKEIELADQVHENRDEQIERFLDSLRRKAELKFKVDFLELGEDFEATWNTLVRAFAKRRLESIAETRETIPERQFEVLLCSNDLALKGRIDVIENGLPLEIKPGVPPLQGHNFSHSLQLTLYALLIENKFSRDVNQGIIYYPLINKTDIVTIDERLRWEALRQRNLTIATIIDDVPPDGRCKACTSDVDTQERISNQNSRIACAATKNYNDKDYKQNAYAFAVSKKSLLT